MRFLSKIACFLLLTLSCYAKTLPVVILDPGHGGKDEGAHIRNILEKKLTLRTCYLAKKHLESLGYRVIMTRARDVFLPLETRVARANYHPSSIFVSIHYNSSASPDVKGIEIYYYGRGKEKRIQSSKNLAKCILTQMVQETTAASRGIKKGNFQVIRETTMPAVLIEAAFITNTQERALINTHAYLNKLAHGIAKGIDQFIQPKR